MADPRSASSPNSPNAFDGSDFKRSYARRNVSNLVHLPIRRSSPHSTPKPKSIEVAARRAPGSPTNIGTPAEYRSHHRPLLPYQPPGRARTPALARGDAFAVILPDLLAKGEGEKRYDVDSTGVNGISMVVRPCACAASATASRRSTSARVRALRLITTGAWSGAPSLPVISRRLV